MESIMSEEKFEPAFPSERSFTYFHGMSLRDYFAAQAMNAFVDKDQWQSSIGDVAEDVAFKAYALADAMLEARK
jgi:hypothetical protein